MTMIKSVFIGEKFLDETIDRLLSVRANHFIVDLKAVNTRRWDVLAASKATLTISLNAFDHGGCPLDPNVKKKLQERIKSALLWEAKEIWFDHFRFDGHWEAIRDKEIPGVHETCKWCKGKDRPLEIRKLAEFAAASVGEKARCGYFAVPFKKEELPELVSGLGQDHRLLGQVFDMASPMLYYRMIKRRVSYISEYVGYLKSLSEKPVLPIIQIKDMPNNLSDTLEWGEFKKAFDEAKKLPSSGVSIFNFTHAVEKDKVDWIRKAFTFNE